MFRKVLGLVTFPILLAASAGCAGYSEEKSTQICAQEAIADEVCVTDEEVAECVDCYMECGGQCRAQRTCPVVFSCGED